MENYLNYTNESLFYAHFSHTDDRLKYFLQTVKLPSVVVGIRETYKQGIRIPIPGDSRDNGEMPVTFILDENYYVYTDLLEYQEKYRAESNSDDFIEVYIQNTQNQNILKFVFYDFWISDIEGPEVVTTGNDSSVIISATLQYLSFTWERLT